MYLYGAACVECGAHHVKRSFIPLSLTWEKCRKCLGGLPWGSIRVHVYEWYMSTFGVVYIETQTLDKPKP